MMSLGRLSPSLTAHQELANLQTPYITSQGILSQPDYHHLQNDSPTIEQAATASPSYLFQRKSQVINHSPERNMTAREILNPPT